MAFVSPLDLNTWFLETFAGNIGIFIAVAFLLIAAMCAKFRMSQGVTLISLALFVIFLGTAIGEFFIATVIIIGLVSFWALARLFTR